MNNVYIARQPIFDAEYNVVAYELLYRDSLENVFKGNITDDVATSLLLVNSYFNFGIENLVSGTRAFVNFDKNLIMHGVPELVSHEKMTIEVLETVAPDPKFLKKLAHLNEAGYTIALDDFDINYPYEEMLEYIDLVKVDFRTNTKEDLALITHQLKLRNIKLLAEKVETKEEFQWAKDHGYDYFQGYYFAKPSVETSKSMSDMGLNYVRLMQELNEPEPDFKKMSNIIMVDVSLTYKLLKLANANMKPFNEIKSIQQGLAILGVKNFKRWLTMAMMGSMINQETNEVYKYALIRSSLLSSIARNSFLKNAEDELSLLGTLSVLDVILEMRMEDILENLPLAKNLKDTLLGKNTEFTDALKLSLAYEKAEFDDVESSASRIGYDWKSLPEHYVSAISWAEKTYRSMHEKNPQ
ncbi:MAG: EAL domain-containing protein [Clostridia bacterium]|nr:EAL domain-containing protein [Clostridia bacterium]